MMNQDLSKIISSYRNRKEGICFINSSQSETFISYNELYESSLALLLRLRSAGLKENDELIFQFDENKPFIITFWACILGRIRPVPVTPAYTPENRKKLINVWNVLNSPKIIAGDKVYESLITKLNKQELKNFSREKCLLYNELISRDISGDANAKLPEIIPEDIALIQFSSGSTGTPKGVTLTHRNLISNINAIIKCADLLETDSTLGWMPLTHDLGLIGFHLTPLVKGINQYLIPTEIFVRRPSIWMDKINEHRITFTASPNFGYKHFMAYHDWDSKLDLSCVRRILNGAEPISIEVCESFLNRLQDAGLKKESMFPVYGMAEACLAVAFPDPHASFEYITVERSSLKTGEAIREAEEGLKFISVGKPVDDCSLRVCDDNFIPLADGHVGNIQIRGINVTAGYYNNPERTRADINEDGWLNTGDLGFIYKGKTYITGRLKDIIFSNGINLYPHDLERIAEEIDGITAGKVVFSGMFDHQLGKEEVLCFILHRGTMAAFYETTLKIRSLISKRVAIEVDHIIPVDAIPKTTSGKFQRYLLTEEYKKGSYEGVLKELEEISKSRVHVDARNENEKQLLALWSKILGKSITGIDENFFEYGGNSLKASMLVSEIARLFHVEVSIREFFKNPTVCLLSELIEGKVKKEFVKIPVISKRRYYPCAASQKRMYVLHCLSPGSLNYNITAVHKIEGPVDVKKLEYVFKALIERHQILRTSIEVVNGEPVQLVKEQLSFEITHLSCDESDWKQEISLFIKPFDLSAERLFRVGLLRPEQSPDVSYLIFDIHHILADGYSLNRIVSEFSVLYNGGELEPMPIDFKDYAVWEQDFYSSGQINEQENYWLNQFKDEIPVLNLPLDHPRGIANENNAGVHTFRLERDVYEMMHKRAGEKSLTFYSILLSSLYILLHKYSGDEDIVIGTPVVNRPHADLINLAGPFVNSLAIRNKPAVNKKISGFAEEVNEVCIDAFTNQNYPFEYLIEKLSVKRDLSRNPLFDVLFVLQNTGISKLELKDLKISRVPFSTNSAKFDLNFQVTENNNGFDVQLEYSSNLFRRETIEQLSAHFVTILKMVCDPGEETIGTLNYLGGEEAVSLAGNHQGKEVKLSAVSALEKFKTRCISDPHKIALVSDAGEFSRNDIDAVSNFYAKQLKEKGIRPGDLVGISFEDPGKIIFAVIAAWKAGAAYVPIDPNNPRERRDFITTDAGIRYLFCDYATGHSINTINIDLSNRETDFIYHQPEAEDLAYVIYTSGTTGLPKGTKITQRSLVNYTDWLYNSLSIVEGRSSVLLSSYAFDLGYTSLFGTLLNGGELHVLAEENRKDPSFVIDYIVKNEISFIKTTPSQLFTFVNAHNSHDFSKATQLKQIFIGGENIKVADLVKIKEWNPEVNFINHYGPTESTIGCIAFPIEALEKYIQSPVIGKPIQNSRAFILDKNLELVPAGVTGQLYLSGAGLSAGYLNRQELTAEKFFFHEKLGARLYNSGDLAARLNDGTIRLLGRNDGQVKIRGYRVEITGVEREILALEGVKDVVVTVQKDKEENNFLCAYLITDKKENSYRNLLSGRLPDFMIPSHFVLINALPVTSNGKLDMSKLPAAGETSSAEKNLPASEMQLKLAAIWKEVLGIHGEIGISDNFFELGGHSLKATIVISKIHKAFNVSIPLKEFFVHPEIARLETLILSKEKNPYAAIPLTPVKEHYPASSSQKRMFVLKELEGNGTSYNMPGAFRVSGPLEYKRLKRAFEGLIRKHESLRTSFKMVNGEVLQVIHNSFDFHIEFIETEDRDPDAVIRKFIRSFDLSKAPLFRVGLYKESENNHLLIFDIHHIVSDGSSMGIIIKDFIQLYDKQRSDKLKIQYRDFSVWQRSFFNSEYIRQQKQYWLEEFQGSIPVLELPTDFERPKVQHFAGESFSFEFNKELTRSLRNVCREQNITMFMLLTGIYSIFLAKQTGQNEFVIGTPVAGRPHADLEGIVGVFLNTLAIKTKPEATKSVKEFLQDVKQKALRAYENQDYPFDELVESVQTERQLNRNPLFDTMLVVQNMDIADLKTAKLTFEQYEFDLGSTQLDLSFIVFENDETLDFTVNYSTSLFKRTTIEKFRDRLIFVAKEVTEKTERNISEINSLSEKELSTLLFDFNNTKLAYDKNLLVPARISEQALLHPEKTAVTDDTGFISYRDLDKRSNQLANLLNRKGLGKGAIVPVITGRSLNTVVALLGILKSGAAYVFLDPVYPKERIQFMLADCNSKFLITETVFENTIPYEGEKFTIDNTSLENESSAHVNIKLIADDLAYLIYTSGSTGKPKGVMISHGNMNSFIAWAKEEFRDTDFEIVYNSTSYSFDLSIYELFYTLSIGKEIRIIQDGLQIAAHLPKDKKVLINTVPVVVKELIASNTSLNNVVAINMAGEPIPQQIKNMLDFNRIEARNLYGPSEDTTYSTCFKFSGPNKIQNIGKPIANTCAYILDKGQKMLPIGVAGELCLGGDGVAKGYHNRESLTAEKFIDDPFAKTGKLYKTGDLARWLDNGEIEYLGRIDTQVKIKGFRIELGEIEKCLIAHPEISDCVVTDLVNEQNGDKFLCAYYVTKNGNEVNELRRYLSDFLPKYMIPSNFVKIERIPTLPNGKTDKKSLPYPDVENREEKLVLPVNEIQSILVEAFKDITAVEHIGINTNFFSVGGDSIKAIQLASKLQQKNLKVEVRQIFEYPTIAELAPHVVYKQSTIDQGEVTGEYLLSPVQNYFFESDFAEKDHWNQSVMLRCRERIDPEILNLSISGLIKHHDILRSSFMEKKGIIKSADAVHVQAELFVSDDNAEILAKCNELQSSLNIEKGNVVKVALFRKEKADYLLIVMHHLVVDGISWRVIAEDLQSLYNGNQLPLKTNSFGDWTASLNEFAQNKHFIKNEYSYWKAVEENANVNLFDAASENNFLKNSSKAVINLDAETTQLFFGEANIPYNTEANDLLLTGLARAFNKWKGCKSLTITLEGHGREDLVDSIDVSRTLGWFTSMFPVNVGFNEDLRQNIITNKDSLHKIPYKGIGYSLLRYYAKLQLTTRPQVSFNYLGETESKGNNGLFSFSGLSTGNTVGANNKRHHVMDFNLMRKKGELVIEVTYANNILTTEDVEQLLELYRDSLLEIIGHCTGKEEAEVTLSDMSYDISVDDFENIF